MAKFGKALTPAVLICALLLLGAAPAWATQSHGGSEGIIVHQMAHFFFICAMVGLDYSLRKRNLVAQVGWRRIQFAALFFILWNLDVILVHMLDGQFELVAVKKAGPWKITLTAWQDSALLKIAYYVAKHDHLLCVPALWFLYSGLKHLLAEASPLSELDGRP